MILKFLFHRGGMIYPISLGRRLFNRDDNSLLFDSSTFTRRLCGGQPSFPDLQMDCPSNSPNSNLLLAHFTMTLYNFAE
jgi:hypothetical protein